MTFSREFWLSWRGALVVGVVLRLMAAWAGYGYFASDDYFHVVEPAWRWFTQPNAGIPSSYRTAVPAILVHALMWLARGMGVEAPHHQLQVVYTVLGLFHCVAIPAAYLLAKPRLGATVANAAAWLMAVHALLPRIGTRAMVEAMSQPFLLLGLAALQYAADHPELRTRVRAGLLAGLILGTAVMLRLQLATAAPGALLALVLAMRSNVRGLLVITVAVTAGMVPPVVVQGLVDQAYLGQFLAYPARYVGFNVQHVEEYGLDPWHTYVGLLLAYSMPPTALVLWRPLLATARAHLLTTASLLTFLVVHSGVGHKEDRFIFPALPLWLVLLAGMLVAGWSQGKLQRAAVVWFGVLNTALLMLLIFSDEHRNATTPLAETVTMTPRPLVVGAGQLRLPALYANGEQHILFRDTPDELVTQLQQQPPPSALRWLALTPPPEVLTRWLDSHGYRCGAPSSRPSGLLDQLLVLANPKNNPRRRPSVVVDCVLP